MEDLSKFVESLESLLFDNHLTGKQLADEIGIRKTTVYNFLNQKRQPSIDVLIRIADYFQVTTDFLLGIEPESSVKHFKPCPSFSEQIKFLMEQEKLSIVQFCKKAEITRSVFYSWKSGKSVPTLDYVLKLKKHFHCSVDYILGREC